MLWKCFVKGRPSANNEEQGDTFQTWDLVKESMFVGIPRLFETTSEQGNH